MSERISPVVRRMLLLDCAEGRLSNSELAEKYNKAYGTIAGFKNRNKEEIEKFKAETPTEVKLWITERDNRLRVYQDRVEHALELLEEEDNPKYERIVQTGLRSVAEELGALKSNLELNQVVVKYSVEPSPLTEDLK